MSKIRDIDIICGKCNHVLHNYDFSPYSKFVYAEPDGGYDHHIRFKFKWTSDADGTTREDSMTLPMMLCSTECAFGIVTRCVIPWIHETINQWHNIRDIIAEQLDSSGHKFFGVSDWLEEDVHLRDKIVDYIISEGKDYTKLGICKKHLHVFEDIQNDIHTYSAYWVNPYTGGKYSCIYLSRVLDAELLHERIGKDIINIVQQSKL